MKLYVVGPITGMKDRNYPAFREAERQLKAVGYDVESPVQDGDENKSESSDYNFFMRRGITQLCQCDGIAFLPGATNSVGAVREIMIGQWIGITSQPIDAWLSFAKRSGVRS